MVFGIDFDNTISTDNFPDTGELIPMAKDVINMLSKNGHELFLWTVRGEDSLDHSGNNSLQAAIDFCHKHKLKIKQFNFSKNHPSTSPKQLADYYIDDRNLTTKTIIFKNKNVVDWCRIAIVLERINAISTDQLEEILHTAVKKYPDIWKIKKKD